MGEVYIPDSGRRPQSPDIDIIAEFQKEAQQRVAEETSESTKQKILSQAKADIDFLNTKMAGRNWSELPRIGEEGRYVSLAEPEESTEQKEAGGSELITKKASVQQPDSTSAGENDRSVKSTQPAKQSKRMIGGMADVMPAWDTKINRRVVIKFPKFKYRDEKDLFEQEKRIAAQLSYVPHLVMTHDTVAHIDEEGRERLGLVMEYVDGEDISDYVKNLRERGDIFQIDAMTGVVGLQICSALRRMHENNVYHGDIKPENVVLTPSEKPFEPTATLLDYGNARIGAESPLFVPKEGADINTRISKGRLKVISSDVNIRAEELAREGLYRGSAIYAPPELFMGAFFDKRSVPADIYCVGETLYKLLTGKHAYIEAKTEEEIATNKIHGIYIRPSEAIASGDRVNNFRSGDKSALEEVINSALDPDMTRRPIDAQQTGELIICAWYKKYGDRIFGNEYMMNAMKEFLFLPFPADVATEVIKLSRNYSD